MTRSRILQAIALFVAFVIAVLLFGGGSGGVPTEDSSGYVPPSP